MFVNHVCVCVCCGFASVVFGSGFVQVAYDTHLIELQFVLYALQTQYGDSPRRYRGFSSEPCFDGAIAACGIGGASGCRSRSTEVR
jgi:hypothetical protein